VLGAVGAVCVAAAVLLLGWGAGARPDRCRLEEWDTEWALIGPHLGRRPG